MTECPFQSRLSAYHDREMDAQTQERFEAHLGECESCRQTLAGIRAVSRLLNTPSTNRMSQMGLARLHATADAAGQRNTVFPFAKTILTIAASVLIIAGAWLAEMPRPSAGSHTVSLQPDAPWEKLAMGKNELPKEVGNDTGVASRVSNWMLENLKINPIP